MANNTCTSCINDPLRVGLVLTSQISQNDCYIDKCGGREWFEGEVPIQDSPNDCVTNTCLLSGLTIPDNSEIPDIEDIPFDCRMPACFNGLATTGMPDNSDISPEDAICNVCSDGSLVSKPNGTPIDGNQCSVCFAGLQLDRPDGYRLESNKCNICMGGMVEEVPDEIVGTDSYEWAGFRNFLEDFNDALETYTTTRFQFPEVSLAMNYEDRDVCCESMDGMITRERDETYNANLALEDKEFNLLPPPWSGSIEEPIFGVDVTISWGAKIKYGVTVSAAVGRTYRECEDDNCWIGGFGGSAPISVVAEVEFDAPEVLPHECGETGDQPCDFIRFTGGASTTLLAQLQTSGSCDVISGSFGFQGVTLIYEVSVLEGSWFEIKGSGSRQIVQPGSIPFSYSF